jgi:hypothetical protein
VARSMRVMDALALGPFPRKAWPELTALTWPKAPPENIHPTLLRLLSGVARSYSGTYRVGVSTGEGSITGLVISRARANGIVWDVQNLSEVDAWGAADLLSWVGENVLAVRGRRIFLQTPILGLGAEAAPKAGFERYGEGTTLRLDAGFFVPREANEFPARPRLSSDEQGLFQLYSASVPAPVRAAEAMTHEEWSALYPGHKVWAPSVLAGRVDFVWELGSRVIGWMRLVYGQRSQYLELLVHPMYESHADKMVVSALSQMSAKVPVLVDVREYHAGARAAFERAGFHAGASYTLWVRQLAARIPEPAVAAAQAPA